jgi:hypothetical protein
MNLVKTLAVLEIGSILYLILSTVDTSHQVVHRRLGDTRLATLASHNSPHGLVRNSRPRHFAEECRQYVTRKEHISTR